ncbi:arginase deacetylase [Coniophora puteana RWD-64-598 SS2]|uniref:histone deacetylase n=1 Tax=Coniophora puteana (strain RWD-64-598) TaxID=741705 RepID=A0A5M3MEX1_CONPW|nr:arginase deacetylase [Coniophora puteana RWD-64-598 SS2]EIW77131.1 arginase deacetylase [Coniophora puteana RWD-64-598 SS2]
MPKPVAYVVSEELVKVSSLLPSNKNRSLLVHSLVKAFRLFASQHEDGTRCLQPIRPRKAAYKELATYHTREYLDYTLDPENQREVNSAEVGIEGKMNEFGLEDDCPPFLGMDEYIRLVAGATFTAVDALRTGITDVAVCWDGGRHHAQKDRASGFCYVADCVLAILSLRRPIPAPLPDSSLNAGRADGQKKPKVMYLDLDVHFSDAVSHAFRASRSAETAAQVLTLSIHHAAPGFFPISPLAGLPLSISDEGNEEDNTGELDPFSLSIPLRLGASCATYARVWRIVDRVKDTFQPDVVVLQCGTDALAGDPVGACNWTLGGEGGMGWCVDRVRGWGKRMLVLGGGGYNSPNTARAWAYLTSILTGNPIPLDSDIPDHFAFPLYQPSFTLDVPAGNMSDQNDDAYLNTIERTYHRICDILEERLARPDRPRHRSRITSLTRQS